MDDSIVPSNDALREKAARILSGRDYHLNQSSPDNSWVYELFLEAARWITAVFRWFFELTEGLPDFLRWPLVIGMAVVAVLLIAHIVYTVIIAIRGPKRVPPEDVDSRRRKVDPSELERLASDAAVRSDFITAIRFLFRASVARLEIAEKKSNRPGTTNRELLRRYRDRPKVSGSLQQFVETIDRKWYGDEVCSFADYTACESAHDELCRAIEEVNHAVSA